MTGAAGAAGRRVGARARAVERRLLLAFLALIAALVVIVAAGLIVSEDINRNATEQYVERALPLRSRVQDLTLHLTTEQSAVRGFILTRDPRSLDAYRRARGSVRADLKFLRANAADDPALARMVRQIEPQVAALERYFDAQTVRARRGAAGARAARALIEQTGEPLFTRVRSTAGLMTAMTDAAVREAVRRQDERTENLRTLLALGGAGALLLALGLAAVVPRQAGRLLMSVERDREATARSEARTRRLQEVTAAMAGAPRVRDVVDVVLAQGRAATGAVAGSVGLLDPEGEHIRTTGLEGYAPGAGDEFTTYPLAAPLPLAQAVREGPLWIESRDELLQRYPHLAPYQEGTELGAMVALPIAVDGRPIGGLALSFRGPRSFPPEERIFLVTLAGLLGQAVDRARLYENERREGERTSFLADASSLLSASLEPTRALRELARLAVPRLADWCAVAVPGEEGPRTVAVAHVDPAKVALAEELVRRHPARADAPSGAPAVMRTGRSEYVPRIDDDLLVAAAEDEEHLDLLRRLGLRSGVVVPLVARARVLGALTLVTAESGRLFTPDDVAFAEDLGRRAGLAVDNARLYEREHHIARTLQRSLLPGRLPRIPGVQVAARYVAAGGEVGGDFYDLFELDDGQGWAAVLGDVCGKGPDAAALTALARHTLRAESDLLAPGVVMHRLNTAVLRQRSDNRFLTAAYAWLRPAPEGFRVVVASGGHPPALVLRRCGRVEQVKPAGPLVGVFPGAHFAEDELVLGDGDSLVLYSDGVIEARAPAPGRRFFGLPRLSEILSAHAGATAEELAEGIESALAAFREDAATDDVALLVVRAAAPVAGDEAAGAVVGAASGRGGPA